jgi:hypothetical protein
MRERESAPARGRNPKGLSQDNDGVIYATNKRSLQEARSFELKRRRRMRHVQIVCALGARVVFEGFDRLANDLDESVVDHLLERLANINPAVLRALGADKLPPSPIREVRR